MNHECLKLTTYFGERDRTADALLADALLDLYGRRQLSASVLLRGAEGFGARQRMRTDRLLTLSEDLPVVAVAVDRPERIEATLASVLQIQRRGLLTLERARLLSGQIAATAAEEMPGQESKLTVYLGRHHRASGAPAHVAIVEALRRCGVAGASVLLGVDGTREGHRARARFFGRNAEVPTIVIAVGRSSAIATALPQIETLAKDPLMTLERVQVCKRDGQLLASPHALPPADEQGLPLWQKLTVYTSQSATLDGHPLNLALVRRLRESEAAGATTLHGIWGFHGEHAPHGDRLLQLRRRVPAITIVLDTPERIARSFAIVDELTAHEGLVTSEMVPALRAVDLQPGEGATALASLRY